MTRAHSRLAGVGLGLRWDFLEEVAEGLALPVAFFEVSPENYMHRGGYFPAMLGKVRERYPLVTHGLTLSIGSADPLNEAYLTELRAELERLQTPWHSDHLCLSSAGGRVLHELLPLACSKANAQRVIERVKRLQGEIGVPFALENISYYAELGRRDSSDAEFLCEVLERSDAQLLLDVNNVYVNSQNHGFDAQAFIAALPLDRVIEIHVAGHKRANADLLIDTHGSAVAPAVYALLEYTLQRTGPVPVLLERDNDVPPLAELLAEVQALQQVYERAVQPARRHASGS